MQNLVSVIIPVYNRENTIKRAIDSVLCQTYSSLELIIVDDGSTDGTVKRIKEYDDDRIKLVCLGKHGGANQARNTGMMNAKGEYIAFQDSDDEWLPDKLSIQIDFMRDSGFQASYCAYYLYENEVISTFPNDYADEEKYQCRLREVLAKHNAISTQTLVIRREVLDLMKHEWFDSLMPRFQDYEFAIRMVQVVEVGYINQLLVNVYRSESSITRDMGALYQAVYRMICKHHDFLDIKSFLKNFIAMNIIFDESECLMTGLSMIQEAVTEPDINVRDMVISYEAEQIKMQDNIEKMQYDYFVKQLKSNDFSIYGAGKVGCRVCQELNAKGLQPKYFVVSRCEKREYIYDIPVISIDECVDQDSRIIIAVAKAYRAEMLENLMKRNFRTFCIYPY